MPRWGTWREDLVLLVGLAGVVYEMTLDHVAHPETTLPVFGAMVAGRVAVGRDRKRDGSKRREYRDDE